MAIHLRRPEPESLRPALLASRTHGLTYAPVGLSTAHDVPPGYRLDRWSVPVGAGDDAFARAIEAVRGWDIHRRAGLVVLADGPPAVGREVAMAARLPGAGWIEVLCRVVAVADEADWFGFTYGTLPNHPERGEESFLLSRDAGGAITFTIVAVSRPQHPLARLAPFVAQAAQRRATARYIEAVRAAIG